MSRHISLNCLKFSLVAGFLLILQTAPAQSKKAVGPSPFPDLESAIENRKKDLGGELMIALANRDTLVYQKAFGDVNNRTQAPLGAASQWLITALVLQLVDEGKLSLDDKVAQYLPVYESYRKSYITLRHCLTHLTGIKTEVLKPGIVPTKLRASSLEEEVTAYAKTDISANAGEAYAYSGMGANIAAFIVEKVTKKKFEQLLRQRLFTPLGMRNTSFAADDGSPANPAFGAKTTAVDLLRFLQMLLNNGQFGGKQILSEASVAEMRKIQVDAARLKGVPKPFVGLQQTLGGWSVDGGDAAGGKASVLAFPSLTGLWPMVDFTRGYAFVLLPKVFNGEQNTNVYLGLKQVLDERWKSQ